jgi:hypothetical protein
MLLLSLRRILSWRTKAVLREHYPPKHFLYGILAKRPSYDRLNAPFTYRHMSARDVVFSPSATYSKKKNQKVKLHIADLVVAKAQPGARRATVMYVLHKPRTFSILTYNDFL